MREYRFNLTMCKRPVKKQKIRGGQKNRNVKKTEPNRRFFLIRFGFYFLKKPNIPFVKKTEMSVRYSVHLAEPKNRSEEPNYFFILFKSNMC